MSDSPLCSFPTSCSTTKSALSAYSSSVGSSPVGKVAQAPHNTLPSTSTATSPLFSAQFMSSPSIQAMENTILSQNPFLNPAFNPLAAFSSPPDIARVQQWFQQNSPYSSPTASSTPSLISNLSGLSIFSTDNSFTLNSQQLNNKFVRTDETLDPLKDPKKFLAYFLEAIKNCDQEVFFHSLKPLKVFALAIAKRKIPTEFNQKDFRELIKILIERLALLKDQRSLNYILEVLDILVNQPQFELAIADRKSPILPVFVGLLQRIAPLAFDGNEQYRRALQSGLVIVHRCLALVKDKSGARNEHFFTMLLSVLRMDGKSTLKFVSLGILRCLIHGEEKWKQFVFDRKIIELVSSAVEKTTNRKIFGQSLRFFNTLLDSKDVRYAESFVKNDGIKLLMGKIASIAHCSEEDFVKPLNCLKLISDANAISTQNLSLAINFAIRGTFPSRESKPIVYWTNILNALTFLRNAIVLNEQARDYLASMDEGRAAHYFADLSRQCMLEVDVGEAVTEKVNRLKRAMLDDSLMILAALCKEMNANGNLSEGQKNVAKIIASNETVLFIYHSILRMDTISMFKLQKTVLLTLNRITKSGVLPAVLDNGPLLSEALLNFLFSSFDSSNVAKLNLMKMCAEVLLRMIVAPDRRNLSVILSSIKSSGSEFRPFELLHSFTTGSNLDSDLYLAMLKIIKELCKREPALKSQWSNLENVQFLSSNSMMSSNSEIVNLCSEVLEMLQMGEDQFQDALLFDIFMNEYPGK
ncbi:hypothetical protein niasHS_007550 [Heterodera schachtii]|uniref:Uncharacterized protein n=1 Tax=Heterodera schachtii TaxID=97005 RepID=A0ABD2JXT7_HETSC